MKKKKKKKKENKKNEKNEGKESFKLRIFLKKERERRRKTGDRKTACGFECVFKKARVCVCECVNIPDKTQKKEKKKKE